MCFRIEKNIKDDFFFNGIKMKIKCKHCGHIWKYKGKLHKATCPSCQYNNRFSKEVNLNSLLYDFDKDLTKDYKIILKHRKVLSKVLDIKVWKINKGVKKLIKEKK